MPNINEWSEYKCSEISARFGDYLIHAEHEEKPRTSIARVVQKYCGTPARQFMQHTVGMLNGAIVFPILASIDITRNVGWALKEGLHSFVTADKILGEKHRQQTYKCIRAAGWCFVGIAFAWTSYISPDLVTRHFCADRPIANRIGNSGKWHYAPGDEIQPKTIHELDTCIKQALQEGKSITISGSHYSQSKDTLPAEERPSLSISMKKLNNIKIDPRKKTAKVQAGATWSDLQMAANKERLGVKVMQASNVFSIGGSIGVNCHGWCINGNLGTTIRSITVFDAKGELRTLDPTKEEDKEFFGANVGTHGWFGLIVDVELDLVDNEELTSWGHEVAPKDFVAYFKQEFLEGPDKERHRMMLYRLSLDPKNLLKEGAVQAYSIPKGTEPKVVESKLSDEPVYGTVKNRILFHLARKFDWVRAHYWQSEKQSILKGEVASRNEIMRPPILCAYDYSRASSEWLQEYFVKGEHLADFLDKLGNILMENSVCLFNASVRYVKADTISAMPYAPNEDHFAVVLFFDQQLSQEEVNKTKLWIKQVVKELGKINGTFYLPYAQIATFRQFEHCYHSRDRILALKEKYDPQGVFYNGLYEKYIEN